MTAPCEKQPAAAQAATANMEAETLISQLPRGTWQERSFAYWVDKQLQTQDSWWRPFSAAAIGATITAMSALLRIGFRKVVVEDLHKLTDVLESERKRPVITIANHQSTMDDPIIWGIMPKHMRWNPDYTRWTLGARELLYKSPFLNAFFALGQTIPTVRGDGIYQLAVEIALRKLKENKWVHVFPEGKVNQDQSLIRFKWGVGRLIMESECLPIVIPMFHHGMKEVMPLGQKVPVPHLNPFQRAFYMKVGDPIDFSDKIQEWKEARSKLTSPEEIKQLDEEYRVDIVDKLWASLDLLRIQSEAAIANGILD